MHIGHGVEMKINLMVLIMQMTWLYDERAKEDRTPPMSTLKHCVDTFLSNKQHTVKTRIKWLIILSY
jgi:hypothetical protein